MSRVRGSPKTGGHVAGTPNKVTTTLKDAILGAFEDAGGRKWLASLATSHPQVLATLVGKLLPQSLANDPENPLTTPLTPEEHRERAVRDMHDAFGVVINEDGTKSYPEYKPPREDKKWPKPPPTIQ
jgi:hypothetical protein